MQKLSLVKNKLCKLNSLLDEFFYGSTYPVIVGGVAVICYMAKLQMVGYAIFLLFASIILVKFRDATPILPLLIYLMTMFSDVSVTWGLAFYILLIPLTVCLIVHFIKFPPIPFCFGKLFLPLLAVSVALLSGGLLSPYLGDYSKGLLYILPLGPGLLAIYLYFNNYLRPPKDFDMKKYLCYILLIMGLICCVEYLFHYFVGEFIKPEGFTRSELGWANTNGLGALLLLCIPACCYLLVKSRTVTVWCLTIILFYLTILLTRSDGALGVAGVFFPFLLYFTYIRISEKNKRTFFYVFFTALLVLCFIGVYMLQTGELAKLINKIDSAFTTDSGRSPLFRNALLVFKENPIFGGGMGYYNDLLYEANQVLRNFSFHSTFFTVIGCMGTVGLLAYVYYFYSRYAIIMERNTAFNCFIFFAFTMFECYGFVDTCEFSAIPQMITLTLIVIVTDLTNLKGNDNPLPLTLKV